MGHRLFRFGALLLVATLLLLAAAGCQKEAAVRVPAGSAGSIQGTTATGAGTAVPTDSGLISPVGGATVISVHTTPGGVAVATPGTGTTGSITPAIELPTPVVVVPLATQVPSGTAPEYTLYTVQLGDTVSAIARRYGTTVEAIAAANGLQDPSTIATGQVLKIPKGGTSGTQPGGSSGCRYYHTVKPGDWIWQIARDYGVDPYAILQANGLTIETGSNISAGDRLCIP